MKHPLHSKYPTFSQRMKEQYLSFKFFKVSIICVAFFHKCSCFTIRICAMIPLTVIKRLNKKFRSDFLVRSLFTYPTTMV